MSDLFGSGAGGGSATATSTPKKTEELDFNFTTVGPKKASTRTRGSDVSTTGVGGGSDAGEPLGSGLLPRRMKQPATTLHNRPTVNAIDDFDDDIPF